MPPQEHLYIITASNEDAKEQLRKSIANPVDPAICAAHFPTDVLDEVRRKSTDGNFYAWGARPGKKNEPNWSAPRNSWADIKAKGLRRNNFT